MAKKKDSSHLDQVKTVLNVAKAALTGIGIPGVEAIPAIPLEIIAIYEGAKANEQDLKDLLAYVEVLDQAVLNPLQKAQEQGTLRIPDHVRNRIDELIKVFSVTKSHLVPFQNLSFGSRLLNRSKIATAVKDVNRDIIRAINIFQLGGQVTVELLIQDVRNDIRDHDAERYLSSLNPAPARFDASTKSLCLANTRVHLLRELHANLSNSNLVFVCLYGSPGTGKSAVAKTLAADLQARGRLAASYFFDKRGGSAGNISLETFISTIAYQFAYVNSAFRDALVSQLKRDPSLSAANLDEKLPKLLLEPLRSVPVPEETFSVILDALDECGDQDHQRRLVRLLGRCIEAPELKKRITFVFTSRPEAAFTDTLQNDPYLPVTVVHRMDRLDSDQTTADIESFVSSRFSEIIRHTSVRSTMPSPREISEFAVLAGGLFEVAAIRLRQAEQYCADLNRSLDKAIRHIQQTAQSLASGEYSLDEVYTSILKAFGKTSRSVPLKSLLRWYHDVVGALASLREPLGLKDLVGLVGMDENDARVALRPLGSVIAVPDEGPIHFYHATFLEFLLSQPNDHPDDATLLKEYFITPVHSHSTLAERSLSIMNDLLHRNILDLPDPFVLNSDIPNLPQQRSLCIPGELRYACLYWAEHLGMGDISACRDLLIRWCKEKMIFQLEALSLLGDMERAVPLLSIAEDTVNKAPDLASTAILLNDCQRLVQMFHPVIVKCAGAIYLSAIPLMPSCPLQEQSSHLGDQRAGLVRGRLPMWHAQLWQADQPEEIASVAFSSDDRHVVAGFGFNVRTLSATTGRSEQLFRGHTSYVRSVAFSWDNRYIVSVADDGSVRIWSTVTGELEHALIGHTRAARSAVFSPNNLRIVSGSDDWSVRIWSATTGEPERVLEGHTGSVRAVAFAPDGQRVLSGSDDCMVRVWKPSIGDLERVFEGHTAPVRLVAFTLDGNQVISGSEDHAVHVWSTTTGELQRVLKGYTRLVRSISLSWDRQRIVSGSDDRLVRVWSAITGELEQVFEGHSDRVYAVAFSPSGARIASGAGDQSVRSWSVVAKARELVLMGYGAGYGGRVYTVGFSSDGARIVSGSGDCSVRVWSALTGELERLLEGHAGAVRSVAFSPNNQHIISGSEDRSVRIWSAATGELEKFVEGQSDLVQTVSFSPGGAPVVSESKDHSRFGWSITAQEQKPAVEGRTAFVTSPFLSPDGAYLVSGAAGDAACIWSADTGEPVRLLKGHTSWVTSVAFSSDGARVVTGANDNTVRVWSVVTGEEERVLEGHTAVVTSAVFSVDGTRVVSASRDWSVRVWSVGTGAQEHLLEGHTASVGSVAISPDGERIVSGSDDHSVRIWWTATGEQQSVLEGHVNIVREVAFSSDGRVIRSIGLDNTTLFWNVATEKGQPLTQTDLLYKYLEDGWVHVNGVSLWLPPYLQGRWWSAHNLVVLAPDNARGSLAFITLAPNEH